MELMMGLTPDLRSTNADGTANPPFMMRQTNYLEKQGDQWEVFHEHTSAAAGWDGTIDE